MKEVNVMNWKSVDLSFENDVKYWGRGYASHVCLPAIKRERSPRYSCKKGNYFKSVFVFSGLIIPELSQGGG